MNVVQYTKSDNSFYPTPPEITTKMIKDINFSFIEDVLEPSAGKGDIIKKILEQKREINVDAIEIDENLRAILKDKFSRYVNVIYDDFLNFSTFKKYHLIIMNPPFLNGDEHLIKAIEMQKTGGAIVCLLNAETIKNPFSKKRQILKEILTKYKAKIEFIENSFCDAERKTGVETAVLICFGMNLPPVISEKLLDVLNCKLKPMNPDHQWISEALHVKYPQPLWAVREYLEQYGVNI